jgi:hypothetical protein
MPILPPAQPVFNPADLVIDVFGTFLGFSKYSQTRGILKQRATFPIDRGDSL